MRNISAPQRSQTVGSSAARAGAAFSAEVAGVIGGSGGRSAMAAIITEGVPAARPVGVGVTARLGNNGRLHGSGPASPASRAGGR